MKNLEVEAILKFYRYVDLDIKVASEWLEQYEAGYNPLGAVVYDGMPHGSTLSDSTALLAVKLAEADTRESKNIRCVALEALGGKFARNRNISRSKIIGEIIK